MAESKKKQKLTEKQRLFCREYLKDLNATQACIRAGYSKKTAGSIATENLQKPAIQKRIQKLMKKRSKRINVDADMVLQEMCKIAFADVRDMYDSNGRLLQPHELPDGIASMISSFKASTMLIGKGDDAMEKLVDEYKRYDKSKMLELIGKHLNMFVEQVKTDNTHKFEVTRTTLESKD